MEVVLIIVVGIALFWYFKKQKQQSITTLRQNNSQALEEYACNMKEFKDVTMNWIIENVCPLKKLPTNTLLPLITYMTEATSSACKYYGVDDKLIARVKLDILRSRQNPKIFG